MNTYEVLVKAKSLISQDAKDVGDVIPLYTEGRTVQRVYKDARGRSTKKFSEARCFCAIGAVAGAMESDLDDEVIGIYSVDGGASVSGLTADLDKSVRNSFDRAVRYLNAAARKLNHGYDVISTNDNNPIEVVHQVFDLAIKNAKRRHINGKRYAEVSK